MNPRRLRLPALLGAVFALVGCSEPQAPEEKLQTAADRVVEAREAVQSAQEDVTALHDELAERRQAVKEAKQQLQAAREDLIGAEQRLVSARERYERRATDDAIFRLVQSTLLEDPRLQQAAIGVEVYDREVTLTGVVESRELRDHAVGVARSTAGVLGVENNIIVEEHPESAKTVSTTE